MRLAVVGVALLSAACWTGADGPPAAAPVVVKPATEPLALRVKLERTPCFGVCPAYSLVIHGDGRVDWVGHSNVAAVGPRQARVSRRELEELERRLERARFFERNEYGELPVKPECTTVGSTTSCSFAASVSICSDTSHTVFTIKRGTRIHTIDNDHCNERPELDALEAYIERIAGAEAWIYP